MSGTARAGGPGGAPGELGRSPLDRRYRRLLCALPASVSLPYDVLVVGGTIRVPVLVLAVTEALAVLAVALPLTLLAHQAGSSRR